MKHWFIVHSLLNGIPEVIVQRVRVKDKSREKKARKGLHRGYEGQIA
ncbi:hypothetical protein [Ammoniphilus resinae]|nr:hypothetical protein [Ammoniphilus resinae]